MIISKSKVFSRSPEEYIILALSGCASLSILPFAVYRLVQQDWAVALLDILAVLTMSTLFAYVNITHKTAIPARILAVLSLIILFTTLVLKGTNQLLWIYPALTVTFFLLPPRLALYLSFSVLIAIGFVVHNQLAPLYALQLYISATATLMFSYAFSDRMRKQQEQLTDLATKDSLTGAGNRRALEQRLQDIINLQQRDTSSPATLILMDLDKFKLINDDLGHAAGDQVLVAFTQCITNRIRRSDKLYRFGGEEFVVVAESTPLKDAIILAEELRSSIEQDPTMAKHGITISVGTACYQANETSFEWIGRADKAMYQAKHMGRNHCCVA